MIKTRYFNSRIERCCWIIPLYRGASSHFIKKDPQQRLLTLESDTTTKFSKKQNIAKRTYLLDHCLFFNSLASLALCEEHIVLTTWLSSSSLEGEGAFNHRNQREPRGSHRPQNFQTSSLILRNFMYILYIPSKIFKSYLQFFQNFTYILRTFNFFFFWQNETSKRSIYHINRPKYMYFTWRSLYVGGFFFLD